MIRMRRLLFVTLISLVVAGSALSLRLAFSDVNDFIITNFTADYWSNNNDRQDAPRV